MSNDSNISNMLNIYDKIMYLKIYVDGNNELKDKYLDATLKHNDKILNKLDFIDAGFDLYFPEKIKIFGKYYPKERYNADCKIDYKIICSAKIFTDTNKNYNTGYYLYPRSSIYKTPLRLANSVGIIDGSYRGHIMAMFDMKYDIYEGEMYERCVQICAPGLVPILVEVVDKIEDLGEMTERGAGGFGSTGK